MNLNHLKEAKEYATEAARSAAGDPSLAAYSGSALFSVASVDRLAYRFEEALRGYQEALKFGDGGGVYPVTLESHIGSALVAAYLGRAADVAAHAGPVRHDAARLETARRVDALQRLATAYKTLRDFPAALDVLAEARVAAEAPPDNALLASVLNATGDVRAADGDWPRAATAYKDALVRATAAGAGSAPALSAAHNGLGMVAVITGHPDDALNEFQEARRLDHDSGNPSAEARDWRNIGNVHRDQGRYTEAEAAYREAIRLAASAQDELTEAQARIDLAYLLGVQGKPGPAVGEFARVFDVLKRRPDPSLTASLFFGLGEHERSSGLYAEAKKSQTNCQTIVRQYHLAGYEVSLPVAFGNLELAAGHFPAAKEQLDKGLAASRKLRSNLSEASVLSSLAGYYEAVGRGDDSVTASRQSEALYEKAGQMFLAGAEGLKVADSLKRHGAIDAARKKAEEILNRSHDRHILSLEVSALLTLAEIDQQVGDYVAALRKGGDALVVMRDNKVVWPHSIERARDLTASAQLRQGQFALALATEQELLDQALKDGRLERANSLRVTIGGVLAHMGRPDDARVPLEEAERFARSSGNPLLGFDARLALAGLQPPEPGAKLFRALADEARTQGWSFKELSARRDLGGALGLLGDYGGAIVAFERAIELAQSLRSPADEGMLEVYLGDTYFTIGDLRQTRNHYLRGNELAQPLGLKTLKALLESRTATVMEYLGRHGDAVMRWREVRRLNQEMGVLLDEAMACLGMAASELAAGPSDAALRDARDGLDLARKHSLPYIEMLALYQLGVAHRARAEKVEALARFADARKVGEEIRAAEGVIRADVAMGDLYRSSREWDEAEEAYDRAVRLTEQVRLQVRGPWIQMTLLSRRVSPYYGLAAAIVQSGVREEKRLATAFEHAEQAKARVLVDTLRAGRLPTSAATKPEDRVKEKDLFGRLALATEALDRANSSAGVAPGFRKDLLEAYDKARDRYEDFRNNLLLNLPPGDASRSLFKPVDLDALRDDLLKSEPGVCLLSFLTGEDATLLFVARRGPDGTVTLRAHALPLPYQSLAAQVGGFREVCKAAPVPGREDEYREAAKTLYASLLAPAAAEFHGATHLVISPDGPLNELPFHALIGGDGRHLVEDYTVSLVPSATTLMGMRSVSDGRWGRVRGARTPARPQPVAPALAFGYPVNSQGKPIAPASTKDEVQRVAGLLHGDARLRGEATEAAAKHRIGAGGIIHFATHGVVNARGRDPLYSFLEMTPGDGEDGYLHAFELLDVPLTADLVVLSACETAEGSPIAGEGVPGFAWALFSSGASSSIVSLWQVKASVEGATALMLDFYGGLSSKGDEPVNSASTLREAQIRKIRSHDERHPYFWAPFVLVGDWRFEPKILRIPNPEAAGQPRAPAAH
jgi:CHAT domain-containing protein/tetratricopeptide (TPR) repeat protein